MENPHVVFPTRLLRDAYTQEEVYFQTQFFI